MLTPIPVKSTREVWGTCSDTRLVDLDCLVLREIDLGQLVLWHVNKTQSPDRNGDMLLDNRKYACTAPELS